MNAASRPLQRMKRFRLKEFLIGSWCFHSAYGEAYCRAYKGAGFNTMVDAPSVLDDALKTGLNVIITTVVHPVFDENGVEVPGEFTLGPYARVPDLERLHERYGAYQALIAYLLNDNCLLHDYTVDCAEWMAKHAPRLIPYVSDNPEPRRQAKTPLPVLSSQNYPFGYHNDWPEEAKRRDFCHCLEIDRAFANEHDMALWPIFAVFGQPDVGASQIRFQAYASVAYGAQGLFYFAYSDKRPAWKRSGIAYRTAKEINAYLTSVVGPRVLGHRSIGVFHSPYGPAAPWGALRWGPGRLIEKMDAGLLAGVLVAERNFKAGRAGPDYVILVDKRTANAGVRQPRARTARVTFGPAVKKVEVLGGARQGSVSGRTVSVKLRAGDGALLRIDCPRSLSF